jgi:hypothetical protein
VSGGPLAPPLDTKEGLQRDGMYTLDQHHKLPSQSDPKCLALDSYFFRILLVLLCYKRKEQQSGQCGSWVRRKRAILIRRVAIEAGLCRSARARRTARLEVKRKLRGA